MTIRLAILALAASIASAQPDAPPGELARLIALAKPGETVMVPRGVYREHVRIDKPLTLIGVDHPVIDGGGSGDIVEIASPDVTLRGFVVRNTGSDLDKENAAIRAVAPRARIEANDVRDALFGIDLRESPDSAVVGNRIGGKDLDIARRGDGLRLWRSDRALVENNTIHDGRDAILWYSTGVRVVGNSALRCRYALHLMFSDDVTIERNAFTRNSVAIYLMYSKGVVVRDNHLSHNRGPSGYAIGLKETDRFTIENNTIVANRVGVYLDGSPFTSAQPGLFSRNTFAYNDTGITFLPAVRGNVFTSNTFLDNIEQVCVSGRGQLAGNQFWSGDVGNFWSDYTGFDQDLDGVGDFVHEPAALFESMIDREPKLRIVLFSPTQQAIEFVARALPTTRPEAKFIDEVPLMRPPPIASSSVITRARPLPLAIAGAGMLACAGAILLAARSPRLPAPNLSTGSVP